MKILDANILIYAINKDTAHHEKVRKWLERALSGDETVGFAWIVILAFLRIITSDIFARGPAAATIKICFLLRIEKLTGTGFAQPKRTRSGRIIVPNKLI